MKNDAVLGFNGEGTGKRPDVERFTRRKSSMTHSLLGAQKTLLLPYLSVRG